MTVNKIQRQEVVRQDSESEMLEGDVKNVKVKEVASKIENLYRPVMVNGVSLNETESEKEVTEGSTEEEAIEREEQSEVRGTGSEKGQSEIISESEVTENYKNTIKPKSGRRVKKPRYLDDYETGLD
ncbi:hypothetical protein ILUMI_15755 [Ignelater luminosus]|uniref:Uncharacterized protein n=1 Tax=Ignelater luminosus TaxID=2038154 RepID=A0A8K0CTI0_IGNLU|nr:hypothetical protein ILUMI_15755 [Ignelater luminosus]